MSEEVSPLSEEQKDLSFVTHREVPFGACRGLFNGCLLALAGISILGGLGWLVVWIAQHIH